MNPEIVSIGSLGVFTAGVFLASGSVNDPEKEYHLEFCSPEEKIAEELKLKGLNPTADQKKIIEKELQLAKDGWLIG